KKACELALKAMKPGTSGGLDGINSDILIAATHEDEDKRNIVDILTHAIRWGLPKEAHLGVSSMLRKNAKDKKDMSGYRPIIVSSLITRLVSRALTIHHKKKLQKSVPNSQVCFGVSDGPLKHLESIDAYSRVALKAGKPAYALSMDVANAFSSVSQEHVAKAMEEWELPNTIKHYTNNAMKQTQAVYYDKGTAHLKEVTSGVVQGDPMSSIIFAITLSKEMKECEKRVQVSEWLDQRELEIRPMFCFADDALIIGPDPENLIDAAKRFGYDITKLGLHMNISKTKLIALNEKAKKGSSWYWKTKDESVPAESESGNNVAKLKSITCGEYLGTYIGSAEEEIDRLYEKKLKDFLDHTILLARNWSPQHVMHTLRVSRIPELAYEMRVGRVKVKALKDFDVALAATLKREGVIPPIKTQYVFMKINDGGLGIPSLLHTRMEALRKGASVFQDYDAPLFNVAKDVLGSIASLQNAAVRCLEGGATPQPEDIQALIDRWKGYLVTEPSPYKITREHNDDTGSLESITAPSYIEAANRCTNNFNNVLLKNGPRRGFALNAGQWIRLLRERYNRSLEPRRREGVKCPLGCNERVCNGHFSACRKNAASTKYKHDRVTAAVNKALRFTGHMTNTEDLSVTLTTENPRTIPRSDITSTKTQGKNAGSYVFDVVITGGWRGRAAPQTRLGQAAMREATTKLRKYDGLNLSYSFVPLAFETSGLMAQETATFFREHFSYRVARRTLFE
ncbi:hypothetical protein ADUPG1_011333, partial [Aduncisulcus paluster]